jgi:hypothetical protein
MSTSVTDLLARADATRAKGYNNDALDQYRSAARAPGVTAEQRAQAECSAAELVIAGAGREAVLPFLAWGAFLACAVVAVTLFVAATRLRADGLVVLSGFLWLFAGTCGCVLLLRLAELVDRSRVSEARLILLSAARTTQE